MLRAIEHGNNRKVDGWFIRVKKASYGWKVRGNSVQKRKEKSADLSQTEESHFALRDNRSYKDVLLGSDRRVDKGFNSIECSELHNNNLEEEDLFSYPEKVVYDLDILKKRWNGWIGVLLGESERVSLSLKLIKLWLSMRLSVKYVA